MGARDDIIAATYLELRDRDESAFRVTAVAKEAACATSVLYHYFGSRNGLLDAGYCAIIDAEFAHHETYARASFDAAEGARDMAEFMEIMVTYALSPSHRTSRHHRARLLGASQTRPAVRTAFAAYGEQIAATNRAVARRLQDRGLVRRDLDLAAIALWLRTMDDAWITAEIDDVPTPPADVWLHLVRTLGAALSPES